MYYLKYVLHLDTKVNSFSLITLCITFHLKIKNRIANFVISLQAYFALCNKKHAFLFEGELGDHSFSSR